MKKIFIFIIFFLLFKDIHAASVHGCSYLNRVYYSYTVNLGVEYYTPAYWTQYNSKTNCAPNDKTTQYVLTSESNTIRPVICYVDYNNYPYNLGIAVTFDNSKIYLCPIDDYIPYLTLAISSLGFIFIRRKNFATI